MKRDKKSTFSVCLEAMGQNTSSSAATPLMNVRLDVEDGVAIMDMDDMVLLFVADIPQTNAFKWHGVST